MTKFCYASRSLYCKYHKALEAEMWKNCKASNFDIDQHYCVLVFKDTHLYTQNFDCGCVIYSNKYYSEFNFSKPIWDDFFGIDLEAGQKNLKIYMSTIAPILKNKRNK